VEPSKPDWEWIANKVVSSLSTGEREDSLVYLEQRVFPAGKVLPWEPVAVSFDEPVVMAFIDLEPLMNWTHPARYLILATDGSIKQRTEANRPPFFSGVSPYLRLIHQGSRAPDWAAVTSAKLEPE